MDQDFLLVACAAMCCAILLLAIKAMDYANRIEDLLLYLDLTDGWPKANGDAPRSMPLAVRVTALPCIECPYKAAADQQPIPAEPASRTVQMECECGAGWYVASSPLDPCPTCGKWQPRCTEVDDTPPVDQRAVNHGRPVIL